METIGKKIQEIRNDKGMSQADLARATGLAPAAISRYELGTRQPNAEIIAKIAGALGVSPYALVPFSDEKRKAMEKLQEMIFRAVDAIENNPELGRIERNTIETMKSTIEEQLNQDWQIALVADQARVAVEQSLQLEAEQAAQRALAHREMRDKRNANRRFDKLYPIFISLSDEYQMKLIDLAKMMKDAQEYQRSHPDNGDGDDRSEGHEDVQSENDR